MNNEVVNPVQQRSIEKRKRILEAGSRLFREKGYYHTTTAEIAKAAGVSTGIVYRYFPDKKAIFLEMMQQEYNTIYDIFLPRIQQLNSFKQLPVFFNQVINEVIASHNMKRSVFEEIEALGHYDDDVSNLVSSAIETMIDHIVSLLPDIGITTTHPHEKLHMIFNMIESYCHEVVYNRETCKDYDYLRQLTIDTCVHLIESAD